MSVYTMVQYQRLCEAIAEGALIVKHENKTVEYRSLDDMLKIKTLMERDLGLVQADSGRRVAEFCKGL
jgi:hypothetical protein